VNRRLLVLLGGLMLAAVAGVVAVVVVHQESASRTTDWHWDKPAVVDGRTIHLTFDGGTCDEERWVDADETDQEVTLTVHTREGRGSCAGQGLSGLELDATLDEPLGDRTLIDGACLGGDEPLRGNCPEPLQAGSCGTADYEVDVPIDDSGNAVLRVRIAGAEPAEQWKFRWTFKNYDDSRVDTTEVSADANGDLVATRAMGRVPEDQRARQVAFAPAGGTPCEVTGNMPMSYGS